MQYRRSMVMPRRCDAVGPALGAALFLVSLLGPSMARAAERFTLPGNDIQIHNLCGRVTLAVGTGDEVVVEVTRGGKDASVLRVESGRIGASQTLRVVYPGDRVVYPPLGRHSRSTYDVCADGRIRENMRDCIMGHRVTVSGTGSGIEAWADIQVRVPPGRKLMARVGAGDASASDISGDLFLDVGSATVSAENIKGTLHVDVGSGEARVAGVQGDLDLDTGSGDVTVERVRGTRAHVDTGSGSVTGKDIEVEVLDVDTGSGRVSLLGVSAPDSKLDTGSGGVEVDYRAAVNDLNVDTGSGGVTIHLPAEQGAEVDVDTGSGGLDTNFMLKRLTRDDSHTRARIGDGSGRIHIDTGSGEVRLVHP